MGDAYTTCSPQQLLLTAKFGFKGHKRQSWNNGVRNLICARLPPSERANKSFLALEQQPKGKLISGYKLWHCQVSVPLPNFCNHNSCYSVPNSSSISTQRYRKFNDLEVYFTCNKFSKSQGHFSPNLLNMTGSDPKIYLTLSHLPPVGLDQPRAHSAQVRLG